MDPGVAHRATTQGIRCGITAQQSQNHRTQEKNTSLHKPPSFTGIDRTRAAVRRQEHKELPSAEPKELSPLGPGPPLAFILRDRLDRVDQVERAQQRLSPCT